jgi:hypothetical protein
MREREMPASNPFAPKQRPLQPGTNPFAVTKSAPVDCAKILKMYQGTLSEDVYRKGVNAKCPGFRGGRKSRRSRKSKKSRKTRKSRR